MRFSNEPDSWSDEEIGIGGLWPSSVNDKYCCIYRVPNQLRKVNPEAYTPQMLIIGPLHHSTKLESLNKVKPDLRDLYYINMERWKKKYLKGFTDRYGAETVEELMKIIERDEQIIRASYAESTDWIKSREFVEMILRDSVFILRFFFQSEIPLMTSDFLVQQPGFFSIMCDDLVLLENQLPFFFLEELFEPFILRFVKNKTTFRDKIVKFFYFERRIGRDVKFRHITDLYRHVRVVGINTETIDTNSNFPPMVTRLTRNANMLNCAGVDFTVETENEKSLAVKFQGGILTMPCFHANHYNEKIFRNIIALEQCHYPTTPLVCRYIKFLDLLLHTEQDVDLLVEKGVIKNWLEPQESVKKMVGKLYEGVTNSGFNYYWHIPEQLNKHCTRRLNTLRINMSIVTLRRVYFKDLWTGTATVSAVVLLVLTLIGTVASILQVTQVPNNSSKPSSPPASARGL